MKISVGVLVLSLALCQAVPGWKDGKKYIYDYTAKFGSGVSDDAVTQCAGKGLKAQLHVYHTDGHLAVELHDIKMAEYNKRLHDVHEVVHLNYEAPKDQEAKAVEELEKTFYGVYGDHGKIVASKHTGSTENVYTNTQRAILSLLQLVFPADKAHEHYYTVEESGIGGDCQTSYIIQHHHDDYYHEGEVMNITKNYKYDDCSYNAHWFFSSLIGYECEHCREDHFDQLRRIGRIDYGIRGKRDDYTIERIDATGYIGYTPFTTNGQTAMSITNQTLELVKVEDGATSGLSGDAKQIDGLYFKFNMENVDFDHMDLKENHALDRVYPTKYVEHRYADLFGGEKDNVKQATQLLEKLNHKFEEYHEIAKVTDLLGHVLFTFDYADFEKFFSENIKTGSDASPEDKDRRNYILKLLTIVGTNPSILYALDRIRAKDVPEKLETEMLYVLPLYAKTPSKPLIDEYWNFVKSDHVNEDKHSPLHSAAWLAYGTLLYRGCEKDTFNHHPQRRETFVSQDHCHNYVKELVDRFHSASDSNEQSIYLRALKNTQSDAAYEVLINEVIPHGEKYDEYVRAAAIWGLEHYADDEDKKDKIKEVLLPILTDHDEDYQLRIYSYDILLYINPTSLFFSNLLVMVNEEPSEQVSSYIITSLTSIANTTDPCYENVAKQARHILPYFIHRDYDYDLLRHSTNKIYAFYNEQYGYGRTTQFITIGGNNTAVPREVYMRQSFNMGGYNFDFVELGLIQRDHHGVDTFLAAALQQYHLMMAPKIGGEDYVKKPYDFSEFASDMSAEIYSRIFDQDVVSTHKVTWPKESAYITHIGDKKIDIHYTKVISGAQMELIIPNLIGLPTYLHLFAPVVAKVSGTAEYKYDPPSGHQLPPIELDLDLKYVFDIDIQASLLVDTPSSGAYGYELRTDAGIKFPIHGTIELDLISHEVKTKEIISEESYDVVYYDTQPSTFTRNTHLVPVKYSDKPVKKQYKFGHNYFGVGLKVELSYDYYWNDYGSYRTFFKTFFHKSTRYEDYYDLADKWYAGSRGFLDYAVLNPTARPFHFRARVERSTTNPTKEVHYHWKRIETPYYDEEKSTADQAWSTRGVAFEIVGKGPVERKWTATLEVDRHWPVTDYRRLKFHFLRSPLPNYDDKPYEICLTSETKIQGREEIMENPLNPAKEAKIEYEATLNVGQDCGSGSRQITFKGEGSQSEEQRSIDHEKLHIYKKCKEDYAKGYEFSYACWHVKKDQGRLDHWTLEVEYDKNVNPKVKDFFYRLYYWFRHRFYNNLQIERDATTGIEENHVRVEANFSYYQPIVDVHIQRPHEKVHYHRVFVPTIVPRYEPITVVEPFWARYLRRGARLQRPMCFLSGDYVYTLDGVKYKYPLGDCYHVAVANCLRENVVLMFRGVSDGKYTKALKLVVDDDHVEIHPEGGKLIAKSNGQTILEDGKHAHIHKDTDGRVQYVVYHKYQGYVIDSKPSGLKLYFDGKNAKIMVSNLYHGVQCGMCGDFNNEHRYEYRAVDGTLYHDGADFAHSYAVQKDGCHA